MSRGSILALAAALALAPAAMAQHESHPMHSGAHTMKMGTRGMEALKRASGRAFDIAFLSQMIAHHQGAVTMSREALPTLQNAHVREHAEKIIAEQMRDIQQMTALLRNRYRTQPSPQHVALMKQDMEPMKAMETHGDRMFLQMMIPHHQGAVQMSRLALQKSRSAPVRAMASKTLKRDQAEIVDFQQLLKSPQLADAPR